MKMPGIAGELGLEFDTELKTEQEISDYVLYDLERLKKIIPSEYASDTGTFVVDSISDTEYKDDLSISGQINDQTGNWFDVSIDYEDGSIIMDSNAEMIIENIGEQMFDVLNSVCWAYLETKSNNAYLEEREMHLDNCFEYFTSNVSKEFENSASAAP